MYKEMTRERTAVYYDEKHKSRYERSLGLQWTFTITIYLHTLMSSYDDQAKMTIWFSALLPHNLVLAPQSHCDGGSMPILEMHTPSIGCFHPDFVCHVYEQ